MNAVVELSNRFGPRLVRTPSKLAHYCRDESWHSGPAPAAVVYPHSTEEVAAVVRVCGNFSTPVIAYGAGTSLEGHVIVVNQAVIIDFREMNEIISVNASDLDCVCQPGVTREQLNRHLRDTGLYFPIDPGANATIGGMVATSASGTTAVRYGSMKENVLSLQVVMADGSVVSTGRRARKTAAGYDLTHLFVGSEGTLGIVTEVCLRLRGIQEDRRSATCNFQDLADAVEAVIEIVQLAIPVARIEFMDEHQVDACNRYTGARMTAAPTLLFEFHGSSNEVADHYERVRQILEEHGSRDFAWAKDAKSQERLWSARYSALAAAKALRAGAEVLITDVAVPISRLADCVSGARRYVEELKLTAPIVGHVGDGNFHVFCVIDPGDAGERAAVMKLHEQLGRLAIGMGGTCTGEHGIGLGKKELLEYELGSDAVNVMRLIKRALDPRGLLNPGKIFDQQ